MPESVNYTFFTEQDRKEFVLHLFQSLVLGGEICQYEDTVSPYLTVTKSIYKDLIGYVQTDFLLFTSAPVLICVRVVRDAQTSTIRTTSQVYKVEAAAGSLNDLFPFRHPQNYCYLILDPLRKLCCFMYHASTSYY
jgi:hypothetical protein